MIPLIPVIAGGAAGAIGGLAYLLGRLLRKRRRNQQRAEQEAREQRQLDRAQEAARRAELQRAEEEERSARAAQQVQEIAKRDPDVGQMMLDQAGLGSSDLKDVSESAELAEKVARNLSDWQLQSFDVASRAVQDLEVDVRSRVTESRALWPTSDIRPELMAGMHQLPDALLMPEQMMMDDDLFYARLATEELFVMQSFEQVREERLLYLLVDVSRSMLEPMPSGMPKHIWARGVAVRLLTETLRGKSRFYLRFFDGSPHAPQRAFTQAEARKVVQVVLQNGFSGSGTNIMSAFGAAVGDIRTRGGDFSRAEVVLISDGEDESMNNVVLVKELKGSDIRLHAAMIGTDNPAIKLVADTYHRFA